MPKSENANGTNSAGGQHRIAKSYRRFFEAIRISSAAERRVQITDVRYASDG